jgi:hypothetical protein
MNSNASIYSSWHAFYQVVYVLFGYLVPYHVKLVSQHVDVVRSSWQ